MFGKVFGSMFEGSLVGKGAMVFTVMSYAIARAYPVGERMQVTLNAQLIAAAIGEPVDEVKEAIEFLCSPDPDSTSKEEEGRRLVKIGSFEYWLVNGMKYRAIRDEEQRREQLRSAQQRFRERTKARRKPQTGERAYRQSVERGATEEELDRVVNTHLPEKAQRQDPFGD